MLPLGVFRELSDPMKPLTKFVLLFCKDFALEVLGLCLFLSYGVRFIGVLDKGADSWKPEIVKQTSQKPRSLAVPHGQLNPGLTVSIGWTKYSWEVGEGGVPELHLHSHPASCLSLGQVLPSPAAGVRGRAIGSWVACMTSPRQAGRQAPLLAECP